MGTNARLKALLATGNEYRATELKRLDGIKTTANVIAQARRLGAVVTRDNAVGINGSDAPVVWIKGVQS